MIFADEIEERKRLNTIFKKIMENSQIREKYQITTDDLDSITKGKQSKNKYIQAIACALEEVYKTLKKKKEDCAISGKQFTGVLEESEQKTIYRKIVSPLVSSLT